MALIGVLVGLAGTDVNSGVARFTFGLESLQEGIDFAVVAMGLFAVADIIHQARNPETRTDFTSKVTGLMPTLQDLRAAWKAMVRGTAIGSLFGILPGAGQTVASFAAYMFEKRVSSDPSRFGRGAIEGVAAPEAANNAAAQTSFIPTLTLGIPGSATMALMLGALMIQGVPPGPAIMTIHPKIFWGLIASMWIGNVILVVLNLPLVGLWVKMLKIPYQWLYPAILMFSCVGVYTLNFNIVDIGLVAFFGTLGYVFLKLGCEPAPFVLGFVLGQMIEENFRRALLLSHGDFTIFVSSPLSAFFLLITVVLGVLLVVPSIRKTKDVAIPQEIS
jgi:TctA family transporter